MGRKGFQPTSKCDDCPSLRQPGSSGYSPSVKDSQASLRRSSLDTFRAFWAVLRSANSLVPGAVLVGSLLALAAVILISKSTEWRTAGTVVVVLFVSTVVFIRRNSFGEAAIALVAGLFPALSITWTTGLFIAFCTAWITLAGIALLISSVRLAAEFESIFTAAAVPLRSAGVLEPAKELRRIAESYTGLMGPVEKAQTLRVLAYRGLPITAMADALRDVDQLSAILEIDRPAAAGLVADVHRMASELPQGYLDAILTAVRQSGSSPAQFVAAFNQSRHIALSGTVKVQDFFGDLGQKLGSGLSPDQISQSWKT
jgi:hypothetical protein